MKLKTLFNAGTIALGFATVSANGATIVIDDFNTLTLAESKTSTAPASSGPVAAPSALGLTRTVGATKTSTADEGIVGIKGLSSSGTFSVSTDSGVTGFADLFYSFADLDVTDAGDNIGVVFRVDEADAATVFDIVITDTTSTFSAFATVPLPVSVVGDDVLVNFSDFSVTGGTLAGILSSANEIRIKFSSAAAGWDASFEVIEFTPIPEPSRAILALAGLLVGGLVHRRRR